MSVPTEWLYVERCFPGCHAAWLRDIGTATDGEQFTLGVSQRTAVVIDKRCYNRKPIDCRCHVFRDDEWLPMTKAS